MTHQVLPDCISQHMVIGGILVLYSSAWGPDIHVYKQGTLRLNRPEVSTHLYPALHRALKLSISTVLSPIQTLGK